LIVASSELRTWTRASLPDVTTALCFTAELPPFVLLLPAFALLCTLGICRLLVQDEM
jgi:hypothetical protein